MILQNNDKLDLIRIGEELESTNMEIDSESIGILMDFLGKNIYSDYEGSAVREYVSNAYDSHISIDSDEPIIVKLTKDVNNSWEFSVEDFGTGLNQEDIDNVIKKYLKSTKRQCNKQLGQKGLGMKCGLAYTKGAPFFFIGRKNGCEQKWMMYEGEQGNKIDQIYTKETTEKNGVKIIIPIKNYSDLNTFSNKIKQQLSYFKNIHITNDYSYFDNYFKIFENDLFSWSEIQNDRYLHICLGQVYYPIDFSKLNISSIPIPIAIKIGIGDGIDPVLSREAITYTPHAKEFIIKKIEEVANYFVNKYNETIIEKETFIDAYSSIGITSKYVKLSDKTFQIDEIIKYATIPVEELKVKGITIMPLKSYKTTDLLFQGFKVLIDNDYNSWKTKNLYSSTKDYLLPRGRKIVVLDRIPDRVVKLWLQEKYNGKNVVFVKDYGITFFRKIKNIKKYDVWNTKKKLKEFLFVENQLKENFIYETNIETNQDFISWDEKRRDEAKEQRRIKIATGEYISKSLNKELGDVTLHIPVRSTSRSSKFYSFEAKTHRIKDLYKTKGLTILFDKDDKEMAKAFVYNIKDINLKVALIGKRELTRLPKLHNFKTLSQMLSEGNKKFRQIITAGLINELLIDGDHIQKTKMLNPYLNKINKDYQLLFDYKNKYHLHANDEMWKAVRTLGIEQGLFDHSIYNVYLSVKEQIDLLDFVTVLKDTHYRDTDEEKQKRAKVMFRFILYSKLHKNAWDDYELVKKEEIEEIVEIN